jgi:superfamily II DNA or RNA helicase
MNQWIERIQQFLPTARIGRIQGQIIDIENKDIVLCMLQSLSMKDYPSSMFDCFGFMIVDEVHHISSEVFSNSLFKIVTRYILGLSATMNRKDGTTYVFKMFLGDVIYKGHRTEKFNVEVRAIDYRVNDEDFNRVITDYRGNTSYSSMITKLCEYNHRSEFILRILVDLLRENENQQIMILAHNKNLLKYLFDAIKHRNIASGSVGYYIGGMKETALKESENKKIVIATYAMASEGLDIKTLTTLIMATPKTDIEQSVGRILRDKNENGPLVIDIIDSHDPFKNQWKKRKAFYMKEKYKIIHTTNDIYLNTTNTSGNIIWQTIYDPDNVCNTKSTKSQQPSHASILLTTLMKPKNSKYKKNTVNYNITTQPIYNDIDSDPFLQGKCFIKI